MSIRALGFAAAVCAAALSCGAFAANGPPLASVWNIAPTGSAGSSGDLTFRITPNDGSDPIEITVPVLLGARQDTIARGIRNSLSSQLPRQRYDVELGAGTNVLVSDSRGQPNFSLELLDSDVENLRVAVQSVTSSAPPTAPPQTLPAEPAPVVTPAPGNDPGNPNQPGNTAPPPTQNLPPPGTTTPAPNPGVTPPQTPTPAPGTPSAPQGSTSPTPSPTPSPAPSTPGSASGPGQ